jgi:hypothetical protein
MMCKKPFLGRVANPALWCLPICMKSTCVYHFCLRVWCLLNCTMSAQLYACLPCMVFPTRMISTFLYIRCLFNCMMSDQLCDVYTNMISAQLYDVCSTGNVCPPVWFLPSCVMSVYLYGVFLSVWYLPTCLLNWMICSTVYLTTCDVCSTVWCLPIFMTSSSPLYGVCSTVWCLPNCMTCYLYYFFYLYDVCLSVWCFPYLYAVCLPVCLLSFMMSAQLYNVCIPVGRLL